MNDYNQNNQNPYNYETAPQQNVAPQTPEAPVKKEASRGQAIKAFIFGIVSISLSEIPFVCIAAIIFGSLAKKNGNAVMLDAPAGATRVFATLGKVFGIIGLILGIIMTVLSIPIALFGNAIADWYFDLLGL